MAAFECSCCCTHWEPNCAQLETDPMFPCLSPIENHFIHILCAPHSPSSKQPYGALKKALLFVNYVFFCPLLSQEIYYLCSTLYRCCISSLHQVPSKGRNSLRSLPQPKGQRPLIAPGQLPPLCLGLRAPYRNSNSNGKPCSSEWGGLGLSECAVTML